MTTPNEDLPDLLGAYALDALDADDRARVERYLDSSATARAEVDEMRETASMLALTPPHGESAPAALWDRIAQNIAAAPATREPEPRAAPVVDLSTRRGVPWKFAAPLAAAAAIIIGLLAYQVVDLRGQVDDSTAVPTARAYDRAAKVQGAQTATLTGDNSVLARIVVLPDGTGYLVNDKLAPLGKDETYQLWALVGDPKSPTVISAGVLGRDPHAAAFKVSAPVVGFALTKERAGGVPQTQHQPLAVGDVKA
jgi:anti-sigma-K factor RskA